MTLKQALEKANQMRVSGKVITEMWIQRGAFKRLARFDIDRDGFVKSGGSSQPLTSDLLEPHDDWKFFCVVSNTEVYE